jgi:hypothetical protein
LTEKGAIDKPTILVVGNFSQLDTLASTKSNLLQNSKDKAMIEHGYR